MKLKLSGSFRRYRADAEACELDPDPLDQGLGEAIQEHRFRSIDGVEGERESLGWTTLEGMVPASFEDFDPFVGSTLVLGLRADVKRIPAGALRVRRLEREAAERREVSEKILPERRREILEELEAELMKRVVPSTAIHQVVWDTKTGHLLFSATADGPNAAFRALFHDTFGRVAEPVEPAEEAERFAQKAGRLESFVGALPADFRPEIERGA